MGLVTTPIFLSLLCVFLSVFLSFRSKAFEVISKFPQSADIGVLCVSSSVTKSFCFSQLLSRRGRDGRFPSHANEAREIDWMEVWTQTSVPARMKTFARAVTPLFLLLFPWWLFA